MRLLPSLVLLLALAGCASSPETRFYSLEPRSGPSDGLALEGPPVGVAAVELPTELQRRALVYRKGPNELDVLGTHRWAGPLDRMVRRTLAVDLAAQLGEAAVILPGQPKPAAGMRYLVVVVREFAYGPAGVVALEARWTLLDADQNARFTRTERIEAAAVSDRPPDVVAAMGDALAELARRIAGELANPGA